MFPCKNELRAGFTLLELLLVCLLLLILLGLGANLFKRMDGKTKLQSAAQVFSASLEQARVQATVRNQEAAVFVQKQSRAPAVDGDNFPWRRWVLASKEDALAGEDALLDENFWQVQSNWMSLPEGIFFASEENGADKQRGLLDVGLETKIQAGKMGEVSVQGVVFERRGSVQTSALLREMSKAELAKALRFCLRSGIVNQQGNAQFGRSKARVEIFLDQTTGRTRIELVEEK